MTDGFDGPTRAETGAGAPPPPAAAGDAGTSFLAFVNDLDVTDTAKVKAFYKGADELNHLAKSGGFGINEEGMQEYLKLCDLYIDGYQTQQRTIGQLSQAAPLGDDEYAREVAEFNVKVANDGDLSLIKNLELMKDGYTKIREAFQAARKNYDEMETAGVQHFGQFKAECG